MIWQIYRDSQANINETKARVCAGLAPNALDRIKFNTDPAIINAVEKILWHAMVLARDFELLS